MTKKPFNVTYLRYLLFNVHFRHRLIPRQHSLLLSTLHKHTRNNLLSVIIMNQAPQPDFAQLSQCVNGVAREVSRLENVPAFNQGQIIIALLQGLGARLDAK